MTDLPSKSMKSLEKLTLVSSSVLSTTVHNKFSKCPRTSVSEKTTNVVCSSVASTPTCTSYLTSLKETNPLNPEDDASKIPIVRVC